MIAVGSGTIAGGVGHRPLPCPSVGVPYRTIERRNTSPFQSMGQLVEESVLVTTVKTPKPTPVKVKKPRKKRSTATAPRRHQPHNEQDRIVKAKEYLATPKTCLYCSKEFSARPGERIDGYKRRETCDRTCAAKRARLRREGKLDD